MPSAATLSRLTLGVAAGASTASGAIVVFDFADVTYDANSNNGQLQVSGINLQAPSFVLNLSGGSPSFIVAVTSTYFDFYGNGVSAESWFRAPGNVIDAALPLSGFVRHYSYDVPSGTFYLGLGLAGGASTHYGWLEIESAAGTDEFTFTRFAFNDVAGQSILAGQTAAVPEASTLGLVGGFFGLVAAAHVRRRRQHKAAASDKFLALAAGERLN